MKRLILGDQKGVALIIALIMLLVLTLIGMSSISSTFFESKISGNNRFGAAAFYASKGGVDVGINRLPDTSAYSGNIGTDETYRSGKMTPATPQPLEDLGVMGVPGIDPTTYEFRRYKVNATGQSFGAMKEIEVQVRIGPYAAGTQYNN
jgi:type II secretory pathway component PulK